MEYKDNNEAMKISLRKRQWLFFNLFEASSLMRFHRKMFEQPVIA